MIVMTIALALLVGVSLGLLGGGGSILTVPLLAYVAGMDAKPAIATSLLVVGVTSAIAAVTHARAGRVRWRVADARTRPHPGLNPYPYSGSRCSASPSGSSADSSAPAAASFSSRH